MKINLKNICRWIVKNLFTYCFMQSELEGAFIMMKKSARCFFI